jgi:SAM-dependent methyltransferase
MLRSHCPLCLQQAEIVRLDEHVDGSTTYTLYSCPACKGQFWDPLRTPGSEWYEHDERYAGANHNPPREPNWNHRKIISFLAPQHGKVLDVGCGTGNFLSWAKARGWEVHGIDFDRNAVAAATGTFGLPNIEVATLGEFVAQHASAASTFDLVTFFDVFEHIDNHIEFASQICNLLTPGGYAAMSMPYRGGARWLQPNDLPPRHLTRWDRKSLGDFWKRQGFTVEYVHRTPVNVYYIALKLKSRYGQAMRKAVDFRYRAIGAMGMGDLNFTGLESEATNQAIRILLKAQDQRLVFY